MTNSQWSQLTTAEVGVTNPAKQAQREILIAGIFIRAIRVARLIENPGSGIMFSKRRTDRIRRSVSLAKVHYNLHWSISVTWQSLAGYDTYMQEASGGPNCQG